MKPQKTLVKPHKVLIFVCLAITIAVGINHYSAPEKTVDLPKLQAALKPTVTFYPEPKPMAGKLHLINDKQQTQSLSTDKWQLLYFGYTSCPDICPVDLALLKKTRQLMTHKNQLQVVFVSIDPKRDIGRLNQYVSAFDKSFIGLTITPAHLHPVSQALGVYHEIVAIEQRAQQDHSNHTNHDETMDSHTKDSHTMASHDQASYLINHTGSYLLFNEKTQLVALLTSPHHADKMAQALDIIIETLGE